jgi:hypothetical protein
MICERHTSPIESQLEATYRIGADQNAIFLSALPSLLVVRRLGLRGGGTDGLWRAHYDESIAPLTGVAMEFPRMTAENAAALYPSGPNC